MSLAFLRLNDIISGMAEENMTLCYSLGEGLKGRKDGQGIHERYGRRGIMRPKGKRKGLLTGEF